MTSYIDSLRKCINYIEENLFDEIDLDSLCKNIGYSKYHLSRVFNSKLGISITEYINSRRLSESALLLKNTDKSIIDIAFDCGYNSDDYYVKKFREKFNITPNSYRKTNTFIAITNKYNVKGEDKMKFNSVDELVKYLFKNSNSKEELTNTVLKIDNCIISKVEKTNTELISVIFPEDKFEEIQIINLNMITGKNSSQRLFKTRDKDVHINNLNKTDNKIEFVFTDETDKEVKGEILSSKNKVKSSFYISEEIYE